VTLHRSALPTTRRRVATVLAVTTLALAAACGGDAGGEAATTTTSTVQETTTTTTSAPIYPDHASDQYAGTENWICHPDVEGPCDDVGTTVVAPDGSRTAQDLAPAQEPSFDCFYVYPTTSTDEGPNSDLDVDESEIDTVRAQAARFSSVCRVFAPAYRQITIPALFSGAATEETRATAYGDVVDAWRSYVTDHNDGRSVVVIGHSQGAGHLRRLIEDEIAPTEEVRSLVASALLLGSGVPAEGFEGMPPCTSADDSGCVVSWAAYPADAPPVEGALFGRDRASGAPALCVDPAAMMGRESEAVDAVLPARATLVGGIEGYEDIETPFVALPESVRLSCAEADGFSYLAVEVAAGPDDVRVLDPLVEQRLGPTWGLHLLDGQLAQDLVIELVARQADAHADR
jgi:hypothetical protein